MTVKELLNWLEFADPDARVVIGQGYHPGWANVDRIVETKADGTNSLPAGCALGDLVVLLDVKDL